MSLGQTVWYFQFPLKIAVKNKSTEKKGNLFVRVFYKKTAYSDEIWRKGLPTDTVLKTKEKKCGYRNRKKIGLVTELQTLENRTDWQPHPLFGK